MIKIIRTSANHGQWSVGVKHSSIAETICCGHDRYRPNNGFKYHDPHLRSYWHLPKWRNYLEMLRATKRVVLTKSKIVGIDDDGHPRSERTGYIEAVFEIDNIEVGEDGLRYDIIGMIT